MSKMKNFMMDVEEFVDGYFFDAPKDGWKPFDFTVDEICEDAEKFFCSSEASRYAKRYITEQMGEA